MESPSSYAGHKRKVDDMSSSDEDDARPTTGFRGFARARERSESPPTMGGLGSAARNPWKNMANAAPAAPLTVALPPVEDKAWEETRSPRA
ncbi:uncharacterized protein N7496_002606 [Penicillium cataractarum]|uniref:Uncharacterized protein n=1 Tax=Penicillium cataractarum TaxID=2100454 RepID=A0A9W9SKE0_9EURO|nr:uncharacterized protein N7496_002606 [Penicillium cataractarum]KAJ5380178.1 hypothetical protein N7496_002606 [Penicillium cataractarum]